MFFCKSWSNVFLCHVYFLVFNHLQHENQRNLLTIKMCHTCESHHSHKNIVPCIKIRYSVKKISRLMSSRQANSPSKIPSSVGQSCLYNCSCISRSMPTEERNLEGEFACLEDINLEIFFTEYLIFMHGTIFLCEWCDSQVWHILMFNVC